MAEVVLVRPRRGGYDTNPIPTVAGRTSTASDCTKTRMNQICKMLADFEEKFRDWGPGMELDQAHVEFYADGSGHLTLDFYVTDRERGSFMEELSLMCSPVQKRFTFCNEEELAQIMENPRQWTHSEVNADIA